MIGDAPHKVCSDVVGGVFPSLPIELQNVYWNLDRDWWPSKMVPNGAIRQF